MQLIEERHNKFKEISQKSLADKLSGKREKYIISHEKYLINKKQEEDLRDEKLFKKYEGYVRLFLLYFLINIVFYHERQKSKTKREKRNC